MTSLRIIASILLIAASVCSQTQTTLKHDAQEFLAAYNALFRQVGTVADNADWTASTDVTPDHTGARIGADEAFAAFQGSTYVIERCKTFLSDKSALDPIMVRELTKILLNASEFPGTIPDVVEARVAAEARQSAVLDGFRFCNQRAGDSCVQFTTPNIIDDTLALSTDLNNRKHAWEVSKQTGPALKPGLIVLQDLRNRVGREMGYSSFFALQVADYDMTVPEMMSLLDKTIEETKPLYQQLHLWARTKLAERYHQPVPKRIPAHWLGNRWSQAWPGIVGGVNLDKLFADRTPQWIVQQAERFYTSLGMPALPPSFWQKSDLYELPPDSPRRKNTHASAWHIDFERDVRSLMSVKSNFEWFMTAHHELGHIYYYLAYSNPDVPVVLRRGANRAFHEAIGDLISIAAHQVPYLKQIGVMPHDMDVDQTKWLLNEALDNAIVFIPWSAGTMTHWERDLYENNLAPTEFNKQWWSDVASYQGVDPPEPRDESFCDAATKTHINDDPAQYYDYSLAYLIKYQLHMYIAKNILHQDPHNCNYYGNKEVGKWLLDLLKLGATRDWREVMREKTGEDISPRAMLEYFQPLMQYLREQNGGASGAWE